jgi:hypothetical protein
MAGTSPTTFDSVQLKDEAGGIRHLTRREYEALPLRDRVKVLLSGNASFFLNGKPVATEHAFKR